MLFALAAAMNHLSLGSLTNKQKQMSVSQRTYYSLKNIIPCAYLIVYMCLYTAECSHVIMLWRASPTLPALQSSLVKDHPINRPFAIFRLAKLWFTCQLLHWWCLCTGHHFILALLYWWFLVSCHYQTSKNTQQHWSFTMPQRDKEEGEQENLYS